MAYTLSPNMNLPIPAVGTEPGPNYATDVNNSLTLVDGHTHLPGSGVLITPGAININEALTFQNQLATNLQGTQFQTQASSILTTGTLYVANGGENPGPVRPDLFYYDGTTTIQLTYAGAVNSTIASLTGLNYSGGTWSANQAQSSLPTTPANFAVGSLILQPNVAGTSNALTLAPPAGLTTQTITLPSNPASTSFVTMTTSGVQAASVSTSGGITGSMIGTGAVTGSNIANNTIQPGNINAVNANQIVANAGFSVTSTSTQVCNPVTYAVIQWNGLDYTLGSSPAPSVSTSYTYTIPYTGVYSTSAMAALANCQDGQELFLFLAVNGTPAYCIGYGTNVGSSQNNWANGSKSVFLYAGQTVSLMVYYAFDATNRSLLGNAAYCWWCLEYVGQ